MGKPEAALLENVPVRRVVVAYVQARMSRDFVGGRGVLPYCVERSFEELEVRDVTSHRLCGGALL
jgi:hypothetical protein